MEEPGFYNSLCKTGSIYDAIAFTVIGNGNSSTKALSGRVNKVDELKITLAGTAASYRDR